MHFSVDNKFFTFGPIAVFVGKFSAVTLFLDCLHFVFYFGALRAFGGALFVENFYAKKHRNHKYMQKTSRVQGPRCK